MDKNPAPTIGDVARRAGVSIATVSRVVNGSASVEAGTAERVHAAIAELHYVPRNAARVLASRRTRTIGLLLPEIGGWFFPSMLRGIETAAREAEYDLLIHTVDAGYPLKAARRALGMHNTDGLIVFTNSVEAAELMRLKHNGFPLVLLHQTPPETLDIPVVTIENKSGAQRLVDHLIEVHGRRRIVFLQGPEGHEDSEWRERGYRESLEAHQIPFDKSLVAVGDFSEAAAAAAIGQLMLDGTDFDAVFSGDDDASIGVLTALQRAGRRVPDDVAVVGFDDVPVARFLTPPLTTVRAPTEQVGADAVRQLARLIRGERAEPLILLPTELVIRQSCGCR
ncbi:MAG: LacI family transcriptional regulator [Anaerolineaceae bacterium]|nr:LacI family transcriptional regulator [Anaerolineae bacterium]MBL1171734.1 LacI family transcriptional regulator [Chloroflexota bacterium]MBV6468045.1 Catabolite control protein A [Anaerolineales bacterium]MDL1926731.1 LacI family transcriptional regulator [Anaerolineae bacterium AMX1]GJQ37905.1 MAG: LacI family transcriptional regulator [Anaerolineaceae bacterium]